MDGNEPAPDLAMTRAPRQLGLPDEAEAPPVVAAAAILAGAAGVAALVVLIAATVSLNAFSAEMLIHVASMSVAAPLIAIAGISLRATPTSWRFDRLLWPATVGQVVALGAFHLPATSVAAGFTTHLHLPHAGLFLSALLFWLAIASARRRSWEAVLALLITGKFACLLGTLLVFAPQPLYALVGGASSQQILGDQQLAGLIMIAACPLSYVVVAIGITAQAIGSGGATSRRNAHSA